MRPACVRACVRSTRGSAHVPRSAVARHGYRGPTREKKKNRRRRSDARGQKGGKKIFRRERRRGREKKLFGRARKKCLVLTRTQPTKRVTYSRDVFFLPIRLRSINLSTGRSCNHSFFLKVNAEDKKYFLTVNAKRKKYIMTDKSQSDKKNLGGSGGIPPG